MLKKTMIFALLVSLLWQPFQAGAQNSLDFPLSSQSAVLMEASTGKVLYSKNANALMAPASLVKLMTLLLGLEAMEKERVSWDDQVITSENAWRTGGSQMFLNLGQEVSFGKLLMGIAAISANDACVALAEHLYGSETLFVKEMNRKAKEIGLENTRFQNSSGLDAQEQFTTALDMARLSRYLLNEHPQVLDLFAETTFTFNEIEQHSRNPLLDRYPGADGLKTGFTSEAGYNLAASAEQGSLRFITVTLNASSLQERLTDTEALLNYAFRNFQLLSVLTKGEKIAEAPLQKGQEPKVPVKALQDLIVLVPYDQNGVAEKLNLNSDIIAPVNKGDTLGTLQVLWEEEIIGEVELVAARDVQEISDFAAFWQLIGQVWTDFWTSIVYTIKDFFS